MNIEWNKVTWYSKLIAVVLFVGVFGLGFYLGKEYKAAGDAGAVASTTADAAQPAKTISAPAAPKVPASQPKGNYAALVTMTKSGFSPGTVTVNVGQTVRFVNGTDGTMRIYSVTEKGSPIYPGFDEGKSVGRGGTYDFLFNTPGTWGYYNLNGNSAVTGTVIAKAQ